MSRSLLSALLADAKARPRSLFLAALVAATAIGSAIAGGCENTIGDPAGEDVDVSLTITDSRDPVATAEEFQYMIVITNHGPGSAAQVQLDAAFKGVTNLSASGGDCSTTVVAGTAFVMCSPGDMLTGRSVTIVVSVTAPGEPGTVLQDGEVTHGSHETNSENNFQTEATTIVRALECPTSVIAFAQTDNAYDREFGCVGGWPVVTAEVEGGSFSGGEACAALGISTAEGDVKLSGTVTQASTCTGTVVVRDNLTPPQTRTVSVTAQTYLPLSVTPSALPRTVDAIPYAGQLGVTGGSGSATFHLVGGSLPPGLQLEPTGQFSGTTDQGGKFTFTIEARDAVIPNLVAQKSFDIEVVQLANVTLPEGTIGAPYTANIRTIQNLSIESFQYVGAGNGRTGLPQGLELTQPIPAIGQISVTGTPTQFGTFTFGVAALLADGKLTALEYSITIHDVPPTFTIEKEAQPTSIELGKGPIQYALRVTNAGDVPIRQLTVSDFVPSTLSVRVFTMNGFCSLLAGNEVRCNIDMSASPLLPGQNIYNVLFEADPLQAGQINNTMTVEANSLRTVVGNATVTVMDAPPPSNEFMLAVNVQTALHRYTFNPDGTPDLVTTHTSATHTGPSEAAVRPVQLSSSPFPALILENPVSDVFVSYITSKSVARWTVSSAGVLTEGPGVVLPEPPFNLNVTPDGNCVGVPLQNNARVQMLDANLSPTSQLLLGDGAFPTGVLFNGSYPYAYVMDGTRVVVANVNSVTCSLTPTGAAPVYANRRHTSIDPFGGFLFVLTWNQFGNVSNLIAQQLDFGVPGAQTAVQLPNVGNQVIPHPALDVVYVIQDAPNAGIRKINYGRGTGLMTVGPAFSAPVVDEIAFNANATRLYYTEVSNSTRGRICWINVNPLGDLSGPTTCQTDVPPRGIDSDLIIVTPPPAGLTGIRRR